MSILHVLLPPLPQAGGGGDLVRWLARGDRLPDVPDPRVTLARESFRFAGETIPVAALRHHANAGDAGRGIWMCADPAYARSEATGARLLACPVPDISAEEARSLAAALMPLFEDAGLTLVVDTPAAWCAQLPGGAPGIAFARPADALGANLLDCLPQGDAGRPWRRLFNEAQIGLHAHPVNAERAAAGRLPVNALWLWGAGPLPGAVESPLALLASSDDVLRGLAMLAGVPCGEPSPDALQGGGAEGDVLLDLDVRTRGEDPAGWLACFQRVLGGRRFDAVELWFPGGERFRMRHAHRLRFWRQG
jgi:hypothetical protein